VGREDKDGEDDDEAHLTPTTVSLSVRLTRDGSLTGTEFDGKRISSSEHGIVDSQAS
jgi:hypothetical protein